MEILSIFKFLHFIVFIDNENLCYNSYFEIINEKVLKFNIAYFPNFEKSTSL